MYKLNLLFFKKNTHYSQLCGKNITAADISIVDKTIIKANSCIQYTERHVNDTDHNYIKIYTFSKGYAKIFYSKEDEDNTVIDISLDITTHSCDQIAELILYKLKKNNIDCIDHVVVYKEEDGTYKIYPYLSKYINEYGDTVYGYAKFRNKQLSFKTDDILVITSEPFVYNNTICVSARVLRNHHYIDYLVLDEENLNNMVIVFTRDPNYKDSDIEKYFDSIDTSNIGTYTYALSTDDKIYLVEGESVFKDPETEKILFVEFDTNKAANDYIYIKNIPKQDIKNIRSYFDMITK